jgi:hypothetical membrane protein
MKLKEELLRKFRRLQTIISVVLFLFVLLFFITTTDFNIKEIQVSKWGTLDETGWVFNSSLIILSISTFLNVFFYIKNHNRIIDKKFLYLLFGSVSFSLFLTGLFDVENNKIIHNFSAFTYFFAYPLAIFIMSHLNRKTINYNEWILHLSSSMSMVMAPLILIMFFNGMAIPEIVHTLVVMFWNISLLRKIS